LPFGGFALQGFPAYYSRIRESLREAKPLFLYLFPLSFEGEGDQGGEVDK
jgi:hypothetical protein